MRTLNPSLAAAIAGLMSLPCAAAQSAGTVLDHVVVTAPQMEEALVVTSDPKAARQPVPAHDGADLLKNIPGFSVIRKGGTDGDPVFRGMAASRLGILLDGEMILGGCGMRMDPPTAYVFPEAYDSVTVLKGPQSVKYGAGNSAYVMKVELFLHVTCLVPLAYVLGVVLDLGLVGIWASAFTYICLMASAMIWKFWRGDWKDIRL